MAVSDVELEEKARETLEKTLGQLAGSSENGAAKMFMKVIAATYAYAVIAGRDAPDLTVHQA